MANTEKLTKKLNQYEIKNISIDVKDIDTEGRKVKIALSSFNNIDSDKDIIRKGAFSKSINERGAGSTSNRKIAHLRYHDWEHQIGKFTSLEETDTHLVGISELGRSTKGNDALLDYQDGIIREHSIGFNYVPDKMKLIEDGDQSYFEIKEVILWEGSAVTFGANSLTPTLDVSKGNHKEVLEKLNTEMTAFIAALKNGKGTDERLHSIEMGLKVCQQKYISLINFEPVLKTTKAEEPKTMCGKCKYLFVYNSVSESGMGYVKCPNCGESVTQEGKVHDETIHAKQFYLNLLNK